MIQNRLIPAAIASVLLAGLPALVAAQDEESSSPEGVAWTLTSYYDEESAELVRVPFEVEPTLWLQDGLASGSGGCNDFSGSYEIDGSSLRFDEELTVTLALCADTIQQVEDTYLATLASVDGWTIDAGVLELSDDFGDVILTFEEPNIMWTTTQMAELMVALETLRTDVAGLQLEADDLRGAVENVSIGTLRDRIRALETDNKKLRKQVEALEGAPVVDPTPKPQAASLSAAERLLLQGVPARIANYCNPLRSSLPQGTRAAVTCAPNTATVSTVDYYLMEGQDAANAFGLEMDGRNVSEATAADKTCEQGVKSQRQWLGNGWQAEGCYRSDGRAQLRFIDNATSCRKLKVGNKTLQSPAVYVALQGSDIDIARVHTWATRNMSPDSAQLTSITQPISSKLARSPSCPT